jgi:hypothetical protein
MEKITRKLIIIKIMEVFNNLNPNTGFKDEKKDNFVAKAIGVGVSVAVLFATVWIVGRAWKQSQKQ